MRLIHTADWHLGRILFGIHLTEDQAFLLDMLVSVIADYKPDALLISGDIYDRAVPPPEAIRLLDEFLARTVFDMKLPVIIIAGNHDGPDRLEFASRLLDRQGLFVRGNVSLSPLITTLNDSAGPVDIYAVPYAEPVTIRGLTHSEDIKNHHSAMESIIRPIRQHIPKGRRTILLAHAFVAGSSESESERPLAVGGSGAVSPSVFDGFSYVALGHLHASQKAGDNRIRYSGSLMQYSFSEVTQKSVNLVDIDPSGKCTVEALPLVPRRNLRVISGTLNDLLENPDTSGNRDDYIQATLLDKGPVLDPMGKLRELYPNILHIERPFLFDKNSRPDLAGDHRKLGDMELFRSFFNDVTGDMLTTDMETRYSDIVNEFKRRSREAT